MCKKRKFNIPKAKFMHTDKCLEVQLQAGRQVADLEPAQE